MTIYPPFAIRIGRVMTLYLWISLIFSFISFMIYILYPFTPHNFDNGITLVYQFTISFQYLLFFFVQFLYFIWLYSIHYYLRSTLMNYPITPFGAVWRMFPIIYLWGLPNIFYVFCSYIKLHYPDVYSKCKIIRKTFPILFICYISAAILRSFIFQIENESTLFYFSILLTLLECGTFISSIILTIAVHYCINFIKDTANSK